MSNSVLITGGSRGIGAAAARVFAREGWDVAVNYNASGEAARGLVRELTALGVRAVPIQADVSRSEEAEGLVREAEAALGPLDALVCSAGIALPQQLLTDTTDSQWRRLMGTDLDGVFYTVRAAVPGMVRRKRGAIVTVSSMWGVTGGSCEVPYSAAKAGVIGLTRALAKELGPSQIRVNCVAPGVIDTDMNRHLPPDILAQLGEEAPLCRVGQGPEVAEVIQFLASERASFLTGQVVCVDGGMVI
ncbi:SDR family oxidoreductase [Pseudoflavonifractor sp. 60]|uniref:3-oxoacyl-ACP reductase FabG n=1 Tax=Pseudoflavonifractor sp. 60 TaxID=2304576 RepID=UPI0013711352|nr:3-oxoacyl-ACP reductase FabG [Pseudoflavonifractor sp. 60]NBI65709.1 SDR family oxidoreductase [Pseudoflavonifractor sp. 60]